MIEFYTPIQTNSIETSLSSRKQPFDKTRARLTKTTW